MWKIVALPFHYAIFVSVKYLQCLKAYLIWWHEKEKLNNFIIQLWGIGFVIRELWIIFIFDLLMECRRENWKLISKKNISNIFKKILKILNFLSQPFFDFSFNFLFSAIFVFFCIFTIFASSEFSRSPQFGVFSAIFNMHHAMLINISYSRQLSRNQINKWDVIHSNLLNFSTQHLST